MAKRQIRKSKFNYKVANRQGKKLYVKIQNQMALEIKILDGFINLDFNTTHPSFKSFKQTNRYLNTRSRDCS